MTSTATATASPAVSAVTVIPVAPMPLGTQAQGWTSFSDPSVAKGAPGLNPTGVIGLYNGAGDHDWKVYQFAMIDRGVVSLAPGATAPGDGSDSSSRPDLAGAPGPSAPPVNQQTEDQDWTLFGSQLGTDIQVLPDRAQVTTYGYLDSQHTYRVYEIPDDPKTHELAIALSSASGIGVTVGEVTLYDASTGQTIADTIPNPASRMLSMNISMSHPSRSAGMYLKIAAPPSPLNASASSTTQSDSFVLEVTRDPQTDASPSPSTTSPSPPATGDDSSAAAAMVPQSPTVTVSASAGRSATVAPAPELAQIGPAPSPVATAAPVVAALMMTAVATGPFPVRAGAALGGVLDEGDPVPQLDRHDPALVDLALIGLPQRSKLLGADDADLAAILDGRDHDDDPDPDRDLVPEVADPLVAIRSPGGFPLLASSLHGGESSPAVDLDALVAVLPAAAAPAVVVAPATPRAPVPSETLAQARPRPRILPNVSALSGLSVAMTMVLGVMLPDLSALLTIAERPRVQLRLGSLFRRRRAR